MSISFSGGVPMKAHHKTLAFRLLQPSILLAFVEFYLIVPKTFSGHSPRRADFLFADLFTSRDFCLLNGPSTRR